MQICVVCREYQRYKRSSFRIYYSRGGAPQNSILMLHLDINCKRAYQHEQLIMCNVDRGPTEAFEKVHRGHGWGLDCSSSNHHIQKGSNTTLQTETKKGNLAQGELCCT